MNKYLITGLVTILAISGCKKKDDEPNDVIVATDNIENMVESESIVKNEPDVKITPSVEAIEVIIPDEIMLAKISGENIELNSGMNVFIPSGWVAEQAATTNIHTPILKNYRDGLDDLCTIVVGSYRTSHDLKSVLDGKKRVITQIEKVKYKEYMVEDYTVLSYISRGKFLTYQAFKPIEINDRKVIVRAICSTSISKAKQYEPVFYKVLKSLDCSNLKLEKCNRYQF